MTLPVVTAVAPGRRGRRSARAVAGAVWLVAALALGVVSPARAEDDDAFAATVKVDTAADNAAKARELARIDGQRRALAALADKISSGAGAAKLPKLDDNAITNLVASFEVANERMSAVRYLADMTFHFRPAETQKLLRAAGIAATPNGAAAQAAAAPNGSPPSGSPPTEQPARQSVVVLPVYVADGNPVLWDDPNPWREAWTARPSGDAKTPLAVPLGDVGDVGAIDADKARTADAAALGAIAKRNGADAVLVMIATARGPADQPTGLDVTVRRYRQAKLVDSHSLSVDGKPGEASADLFARAATAVANAIDGGWKKEPAGSVDQQGSLTASAPITGLDDWVRLRDRLSSLATIRKVELMSLSRQEAVIEIRYSGSIEQLKTSLADLNLDLVRGEPTWRLARVGGAAK